MHPHGGGQQLARLLDLQRKEIRARLTADRQQILKSSRYEENRLSARARQECVCAVRRGQPHGHRRQGRICGCSGQQPGGEDRGGIGREEFERSSRAHRPLGRRGEHERSRAGSVGRDYR